ncbi:unnamed protein product [Closterium sp. Naga37s-1]|nr:unnamed protein product [Closterium sp. Naga37s-1]
MAECRAEWAAEVRQSEVGQGCGRGEGERESRGGLVLSGRGSRESRRGSGESRGEGEWKESGGEWMRSATCCNLVFPGGNGE